ncbi:MAG: type II toxin-antitoxin system Phd/YefM family antitoxin [Cyanobacteriota bacterium]
MTKPIPSASEPVSLRQPAQRVPMAEAKNNLSALVARVEQGEEIAITRRGVPVVRLVPEPGGSDGLGGRSQQVEAALARLRQLGEGIALEGNLKAIAREGLDGVH